MVRLALLMVSGIAVVSSGCSSMTIRSSHDPFAWFPDSGSFGWVSGPQNLPNDPRVDRASLDARIRKAVESQLATKGYRLTSDGKPDFLVAYHVAIESELSGAAVDKDYYSWGYDPDGRWSFGPNRQLPQSRGPVHERGSLVLDIVDPGATRILWQASAQARIVVSASKEEKDRRVNEAVRRMLERFPPR